MPRSASTARNDKNPYLNISKISLSLLLAFEVFRAIFSMMIKGAGRQGSARESINENL
ncbi:hypothetical protein [Helicobacter sp. T3_23-1056]